MTHGANDRRPTIVVFMAAYRPGTLAGGPVRSIEHLVESLGDAFDLRIVTRDRDVKARRPYAGVATRTWTPWAKGQVWYVPSGPLEALHVARLATTTKAEIVYLQSFFSVMYAWLVAAVVLARRKDVQLLWAPRGELSEGALRSKAWKKRPALAVHRWLHRQVRALRRVAWHASTLEERREIVSVLSPAGAVHVAADVPGVRSSVAGVPVDRHGGVDDAPLRVLFLSRIVPKKNLLGALDIVARTAPSSRAIRLTIAGPKEDRRYWQRCKTSIDALPAHVTVDDVGTVDPDRVARTMADHDLLLFPTYGENYGHVVREAWSVGTPVLTSDATPWRNLEEKGLGWDVPLDRVDRFVTILEEYRALSAHERTVRRAVVLAYDDPVWSVASAAEAHRSMFRRVLQGASSEGW